MVEVGVQVKQVMEDVIDDMERMCKGVLVTYGILVSPDEGVRLRAAIHEYVTRSVEVEQRIVMAIERHRGPSAA
jgi:hypothetical protein